jgi:uncharacterized MnhB-related membrane protein
LTLTSLDWMTMIFLTFLVLCAVAVSFTRDLLYAIIIFGAYSVIMAIVWQIMSAPDIAITEAAAGIGMTTLMVAVIMRTQRKED